MQNLTNKLPLVSVGIPVFNGENYLSQAIESVLNQIYTNLELIISDNGSTDNTQLICKKYLKADKRIRYSRFDCNYGASRNYNKTFELSKGKYFKWLPHDDKLAPDNISKSVKILEENDDLAICGTCKKHIDADGNEIDLYDYKELNLELNDTILRYRAFLKYFSESFSNADFVMGLMRSEVLEKTNRIANFTSSDFTLLAELVLRGKFHVINEPLYLRRIHHGISTSVLNNKPEAIKNVDPIDKIAHRSHAEIAKWYDPNGKVRYLPHLKWLNQLISSIKNNNFDRNEKFQLYLYSYQWFINRLIISVKNKF